MENGSCNSRPLAHMTDYLRFGPHVIDIAGLRCILRRIR